MLGIGLVCLLVGLLLSCIGFVSVCWVSDFCRALGLSVCWVSDFCRASGLSVCQLGVLCRALGLSVG